MPTKITFTPKQLLDMRSAYEAGDSFAVIARRLCCAKNTVRANLLQIGVDPDVRRSMSKTMTGRPSHRKGAKHSEETKLRMRAVDRSARIYRKGYKHSPATLLRMSAALKGKNRRYTDEQGAKVQYARSLLKRLIRRTLRASGKRKLIPSERYVGYTKAELLAHLGTPRRGEMHVDHYVPMSEFFRLGIFNPGVVNALPNLRLISASENRAKGAVVPSNSEQVIRECVQDALRRGVLRSEESLAYAPRRSVLTWKKGLGYRTGLVQ